MNTAAMPADTQALEARLEPLSLARLDEVLAIEALAHPHPWSRRHFTDALAEYRFADAARVLYDFAWDEFCSFYVEMVKDDCRKTGIAWWRSACSPTRSTRSFGSCIR